MIVRIGFLANDTILDPIYASEKIMTDFPSNTANINCCVRILDNPATTLITEEGENGKHNNRNSGPKPCLSSQAVTLCSCLFFRIALHNRLFPSLRITKKTNMEPTLVPIQEYKNPFNNPYAAPFAKTNTNNGKKGRNASMNGNKIPGTGPKLSYLSNKPIIYSSN